MQICMQCGHQNDASATFCSNRDCGVVLEWHGERVGQDDEPTIEDGRMSPVKPDRSPEPRQRARTVAVQATLATTSLDVEPGQESHAELRVRNQGTIVDQFAVHVGGPAAGWASCEPPSINLYPDSEGTVAIRFAPPRAPQPSAGTVPFQARVTSSQDPSVNVTEGGMVTVAPFEDLDSSLAPETGDGRIGAGFELATENRGNSPADLAIGAQDPDQRLNCAVDPAASRSEPGTTQVTAIDVQAKKRHWIGSPQRHPFTVTATRTDDSTRVPVFQKRGVFRQKAVFPFWLLAALALLLILGVLAFLLLRGDNVDVPDVVGQPEDLARDTLANANLAVGQRTFEVSEEPEGTVIAQDPPAAESVAPDTQVDIRVAAQQLSDIPRLAGMTVDEAEAELEAAGLTLGAVDEELSGADDETVIGQDPAAGEGAPPGTEIDITVAVWVDVPDLSGQSENAAQATLQSEGLALGNVTARQSDDPEGRVIEQDPPAGERVAPDTSVSIVIAIPADEGGGGGIEVPDVEGRTLTDAESEIEGAGLTVGTVTEEDVAAADATAPTGTVVEQDPVPGSEATEGAEVNLVVAAVVAASGEEILHGTWSFDFETGNEVTSSEDGADVFWRQQNETTRSLVPLEDVELANLGEVEFTDVRFADLEAATYSDDPVDGSDDNDEMPAGTVLAVRTDEENLAKVLVVERDVPDPDRPSIQNILIEWVTYDPSG